MGLVDTAPLWKVAEQLMAAKGDDGWSCPGAVVVVAAARVAFWGHGRGLDGLSKSNGAG